jgi:hypothetical protein
VALVIALAIDPQGRAQSSSLPASPSPRRASRAGQRAVAVPERLHLRDLVLTARTPRRG